MGKARKIIFTVLTVVILIPVVLSIVLQFPGVQTGLLRFVSNKISQNIEGDISLGRAYYSMPNRVILNDICLTQSEGRDTVFYLHKLLVHVNVPALANGDLRAKRIAIEDGEFNIWNVNDSTTNLDLLLGEEENPSPKKELDLPDITVDRLSIKKFGFSMLNPFVTVDSSSVSSPNQIDWDNLIVRDINLDARKIEIQKEITLNLVNLAMRESHGLDVNTFRGKIKISNNPGIKGIYIDGLRYDDGLSTLSSKTFSLRFKDFSDFSDFCQKVEMAADFDNTLLDFRTLDYFAGLHDNNLKLIVNGPVTGTVANLKSPELSVTSGSGRTGILLGFRLSGLPEIESSIINAKIVKASTYMADLSEILDEFSPGSTHASLREIARGEELTFKGSIDGFYEDLVAFGELTTHTMGKAKLDILCRQETESYSITGHILTDMLDLGRILPSESLGVLTCDAGLSASFGRKNSVSIDSLSISRFGLLGYDYSNLKADGLLTSNDFKGSVTARDPNLDLDFDGLVTFKLKDDKEDGEYDRFKFNLSLNNANLDELNLEERDSKASLKMVADLDVSEKSIKGDVNVESINARIESDNLNIGDISLNAFISENRNRMTLKSSLAQVDYSGSASLIEFMNAISNSTLKSHLDNLFGKPDSRGTGNDYNLEVTTGDLEPLFKILAPSLNISKGTDVSLRMTPDNKLSGKILSDGISIGKTLLGKMESDISGTSESIMLGLRSENIELGGVTLMNDSLMLRVKDNVAEMHLGFNNDDQEYGNSRAAFNSRLEIPDRTQEDSFKAILDILPSNLSIRGRNWHLPASTVKFDEKYIALNGFKLLRDEQSLTLDGILSENFSDTLNVNMQNFDLSLLDLLMPEPLGISGTMTGSGRAFGLLGEKYGLLLSLDGKNITISDEQFGDFSIRSRWNDEQQRFNLSVKNSLGNASPLEVRGHYYPSTKNLDARFEFDKFKIGFVEPLADGLITDVGGAISGEIALEGPTDKLKISSEKCRFNDFAFKLDFTQVPYTLNGPFSVSGKGIIFNDIDIADSFGAHGAINGGVSYDHFKDIRINAGIRLKNMHGLNTTSKDNSTFFGTAFVSGNVRLSGPMKRLVLGMNLTTEAKSSIHIKLESSGEQKATLLTFVDENTNIDNAEQLRSFRKVVTEKQAFKPSSELLVNVKVDATPDAEVMLDINPSTGDVVKARGNGLVDISLGGSDGFTIKGDYKIEEGNFLFNLMGITSKDFLLENGSTISFNGDIMQSELDLTATYRTKASLGTLLSSTDRDNSRRTIDCRIGVTEKLSNPKIAFNIDIPDLDPTTKARVESILNTEDKRMRQVLALLVSGSFVPESESGIVNNTTILYSNASEIMSNQLNNIFRQLNIPIDLGFNYQPTSEGKNMFDVALSTKLFNNRVAINGNIGNRRNTTASKSDFVGDVEVEVKIDRTGRLRLSAFSHSTDEYSNFLDQAQRNGVGMNFQEDFDTFKELFRKIFWGREKMERYEQEQAQKRREYLQEMMQKARAEKALNEQKNE